MIDKGAILDIQTNFGDTPLIIASNNNLNNNHLKIIKLLLDKGANTRIKNNEGSGLTALDYAKTKRDDDVIELLKDKQLKFTDIKQLDKGIEYFFELPNDPNSNFKGTFDGINSDAKNNNMTYIFKNVKKYNKKGDDLKEPTAGLYITDKYNYPINISRVDIHGGKPRKSKRRKSKRRKSRRRKSTRRR